MCITPPGKILRPKWPKRPQGTYWDPPAWQKLLFRVARIRKLNERKKNFWIISHRKKVGVTKPSDCRPYWIFGSSGQASQKLDVGIMDPSIGYIFWCFPTIFRPPWGGAQRGPRGGSAYILRLKICNTGMPTSPPQNVASFKKYWSRI